MFMRIKLTNSNLSLNYINKQRGECKYMYIHFKISIEPLSNKIPFNTARKECFLVKAQRKGDY